MAVQEPYVLTGQGTRRTAVGARFGPSLATVILLAVDYGAVVLALWSAFFIRNNILPAYFNRLHFFSIPLSYVYFIIPLIYLGLLTYERMYTRRLPFWQGIEVLFKINFFAIVFSIGILYFSGAAKEIPRLFIAISGILTFIFLASARYLTKRGLVASGLWQKPIVLVGAGKTAELLANAFKEEPNMGYKIVGIIEDELENRPVARQYPYLGSFGEVEKALLISGVKDVVIAVPGLDRQSLVNLVYRIQPYAERLTIIPNLFGIPMSNLEVETLFNQKTVLLRMKNNMASLFNRLIKKTFDYIGSFFGIILISPILLLISILIYLDSPGPIVFSHKRVGEKGRSFLCYKFRSMVPNAQEVLNTYLEQNPAAKEEWERDFKLKNDPRITRIGIFLRKTSLDELPQLFNVLKGEMSLVGPRPIVDKEVAKYSTYINDYYMVRPGMTGMWQVGGRNDVDYDTRVQMDSWYVRNWSFWLDIVLLMKTINVVLGKKGAY